MPLLRLNNLCKSYGKFQAVDSFTLDLEEGETVGLVGESGCGKSTLAALVMGLIRPTSGQVLFEGRDLWKMTGKEWKAYRRQAQMVFQDPSASLSPRMTVGESIQEPMRNFFKWSKEQRMEKAKRLMADVGLSLEGFNRRPSAFSGGQCQRVAIARAIGVSPRLLVLDEVTASLDVSIQAQILNLLADLRKAEGFGCLFISHDLGAVRYMSDRVVVMYLGRIMEVLPGEDLPQNAKHPYTQLLLNSMSFIEGQTAQEPFTPKEGTFQGCPFYARCPYGMERCKREIPSLKSFTQNHFVACFYNL